ncbi:MAG: hypothetical protein WC707_05310 [Candidatus Babeliaceae bacterium]|jgi:hypothetical protein
MKRGASLLLTFIIISSLTFLVADGKQENQEDREEITEEILKMPIAYENGDSIFEMSNKLRMEGLYLENGRLVCDKNIVPGKHTWDFGMLYRYGMKSQGYDVVKAKSTIRNKGIWGDADSIASTGFTTIKDLEASVGDHQHPIGLHVPIIRELWMEFELAHLLGVKLDHHHYLTMGIFPFQVGRGISLGDAYTTTPDVLGYNPANSVQQYAPGFKLSGELIAKNYLTYDVYAEIADNKADTFDNVFLRIRQNEYGHRFDQARGFGVLNYILAGRLKWLPYSHEGNFFSLEPYGIFDHQKEQKVEFLGDATSKLGTLGLAFEFAQGDWDGGGEIAFNLGHQKVKGIDRNIIVKELRTGIPYFVNDKVTATQDNPATNDIAGKKAVYTPENQAVIDQTPESASLNGQAINDYLKNDITRFRDPYTNTYRGKMAIFDFSYWLSRPHAKIAFAVGYASGDEAPNKDLNKVHDCRVDGDYEGFISLQEVYNGTRVKSAFLLSGAGKIPRVLSFPSNDLKGDRFATTVTRFTNIIFTGSALWLKWTGFSRLWSVNPNALAYWQDNCTQFFDKDNKAHYARRYLGLELNTFIETMLLVDLKFFLVGAVFIPGGHYKDIVGKPINKDQQKYLDSYNDSGIEVNKVPLLNAHPAYFVNIGLEYKF